jgi:hypothetical protein
VVHNSDASWAEWYRDVHSLKQHAEIVAIGAITGIKQQTGSTPLVFTTFAFGVSNVLYDPQHLATPVLNLFQTGGVVGNNLYQIRDDPLFHQGEMLLLFLHQSDKGLYHVIGGPSGRFEITNGMVSPITDMGVKFSGPLPVADFITQIQNA